MKSSLGRGSSQRRSFIYLNPNEKGFDSNWLRNDAQSVCQQFTGLHDKNGKEIYEGDVVLANVGFGFVRLEVKWFGEGYGNTWYPFNHAKASISEVVGNIYENPDLLAS